MIRSTRWAIPPSLAVCFALGVLVMVYTAMGFLSRLWWIALTVLLLCWLGLANSDPYKNHFENMVYDQESLAPLRDRVTAQHTSTPRWGPPQPISVRS